MKLSSFGEKFAQKSGIVELMDDLSSALSENPDMIFMGGGNPGRIPAVEKVFQQRLEQLMDSADDRHDLFGIYQSPQGDSEFRSQLASYLSKTFGWKLNKNNIAISNGSQSAFFILNNLLAGDMPDGSQRSIHLPLSPEYLGYADTGLSNNFFTATQPSIELLNDHLFKYHVDFSHLNLNSSTAALCVSRPSNPTGNVLTDEELEHLDQIAKGLSIPLIVDGAYGLPFPNILFNNAKPFWNDNTILALSLSKLGLPGARTGIIVANEEIINAYSNTNTIVSLACGTLGPAIASKLLKTGEIETLSNKHIQPFYKERALNTVEYFKQALGDLPYHIHKPEGAIFLWLWFEGMPISSKVLYERLKERGVLVVPGHDFFIGLSDDWAHKHECVRVSYAQDPQSVKRGTEIIAEEVFRAYKQ